MTPELEEDDDALASQDIEAETDEYSGMSRGQLLHLVRTQRSEIARLQQRVAELEVQAQAEVSLEVGNPSLASSFSASDYNSPSTLPSMCVPLVLHVVGDVCAGSPLRPAPAPAPALPRRPSARQDARDVITLEKPASTAV